MTTDNHYSRSMTPSQYVSMFADLMNVWTPRRDKFKDWYKLLSQFDEFKQQGLESVVANDPRTIYNLAVFLLTPQTIPYNIPVQGASQTEQDAVTSIEGHFTLQWNKLDKESFRKGQSGSWLSYFNSLMLSTGWYAVFAIAVGNECIADIWNPAEVFPSFDDTGLSEVLHTYKITASGARKKVKKNNWKVRIESNVPVDVYDYWDYCDEGHPRNCVIIANQLAKEACYSQLDEIPVFVSGVGGLPDHGTILEDEITSESWRGHVGESILATNEKVFRSLNRQLSFGQQIVRDTAQPRIVERTKSKGVVNSDNWDKRGAIFHLDVDEDISVLQMPGMPPEYTIGIQTYQAMIQRGGFDYSLFSGGQESGYAQSLTSAHAQQVLKAFKESRDFVISAVSNIWLKCLKNGMYKPERFSIPESLPEEVEFKTELAISVPGDLIQRATTARQLDPNFRLSTQTTMALTIPEIRDPNRELILGRTDLAMQNPIMASLDLMAALLDQADALEVEGRTRQAELYRSQAQAIQANLQANTMEQNGQLPAQGNPGIGNAGQT